MRQRGPEFHGGHTAPRGSRDLESTPPKSRNRGPNVPRGGPGWTAKSGAGGVTSTPAPGTHFQGVDSMSNTLLDALGEIANTTSDLEARVRQKITGTTESCD